MGKAKVDTQLSFTASKLSRALYLAGLTLSAGSAIAAEAADDTIVITASGTAHTVQTAPAFTTVITADDIAKSPENGLPEILDKYAGVQNQSDTSGRDAIYIRGMSEGYTLILVNGKRVSSSASLWRGGDFDYSSIPQSAIERIEVVRGPMSALYGSDAIGGVINIITKTPDKSWSGHLRQENRVVTSGEQGEQSRTNIYASGPVSDSLSLAVSGEIYDRNAWYLDNNDGSESPALEEKISRNLYTTLTWQINDDQTAEFDFNYNHDERPYSLYGTRSAYRDQSIDRLTFSGTHRGNWSWGSSTVTANYEDGNIDDYNSLYGAPQQRELKEKNLLLNGYINTQWSIHNITLGSELQDQTVEDPITYTETGESNTRLYALYLQDEMSLTDDLLLTLGTRLDDHEVFGQHVTPRSYLVYSLNDSVTLKGGVSAAFKAPQAYQMSEEYQIVSCGGSCTLSGNPDLEPETSVNYEIGMEILQHSWDASIALFKTEAEDMIVAKTAMVNGSRTRWWANEDEVTIKGIELVGSVDLTDSVTVNGNYTYLDTENTDGEDLENRPEHTARVTADWQMTGKLSSSLTADYTGEQFDGSDDLPAYTIVDLGFAFQATDSINLSTGVKNIFDIRLDEEDSDFTRHELGQNIYVSAGIDF